MFDVDIEFFLNSKLELLTQFHSTITVGHGYARETNQIKRNSASSRVSPWVVEAWDAQIAQGNSHIPYTIGYISRFKDAV